MAVELTCVYSVVTKQDRMIKFITRLELRQTSDLKLKGDTNCLEEEIKVELLYIFIYIQKSIKTY